MNVDRINTELDTLGVNEEYIDYGSSELNETLNKEFYTPEEAVARDAFYKVINLANKLGVLLPSKMTDFNSKVIPVLGELENAINFEDREDITIITKSDEYDLIVVYKENSVNDQVVDVTGDQIIQYTNVVIDDDVKSVHHVKLAGDQILVKIY